MLPKRPKPGDDDLEAFQRDFLSSQTQPAATLIHKQPAGRRSDSDLSGIRRDVVDLHAGEASGSGGRVAGGEAKKQRVRFAEKNPEEAMEVQDTHITKVLSEIVERDVSQIPVYLPEGLVGRGFPSAPHRGDIKQQLSQPGVKKKSIFARQFEREAPAKFGLPSRARAPQGGVKRDVVERVDVKPGRAAASADPVAIDGSGLSIDAARQIHRQNLDTLSEMSPHEIEEERRKLLESLDPSLVAFLRAKKAKSADESSSIPAGRSPEKAETIPENPERDTVSMETGDLVTGRLETKKSMSDLPVEPRAEWLNMDDVETEKLTWMTDLPKPSAQSAAGKPARFDFEGHVISSAEEIPTHLGLHHHGNEPERAGYSLEELFTLSRSVNTQQRRLGLATLANVIRNAHSGEFAFSLQSPVIPTLLESGLVFLLRWAVDDSNELVFTAAITCLRHLVASQWESEALGRCFSWPRGYELAGLGVADPDLGGAEEDDSQMQQTDSDIVKHDLIKGLLRMDLLPRLRYVLEIARPSHVCVVEALNVLTRIAQHSPNAAYEVYKCPRLMPTITREFLPTTWSPFTETRSTASSAYSQPIPAALRLLRYVCQSGRNITAIMLKHYDLMTVLLRYLTPSVRELGLPLEIAASLQLEAYRLWTVFLLYGYSTDAVRSVFPVLMTSLRSPLTTTDEASRDRAEAVIGLLAAAMSCAADGNKMAERDECSESPRPCLSWHEIEGVLPTVISLLEVEVATFVGQETIEFRSPPLICACLQLLTGYFDNVSTQPGYDAGTTRVNVLKMAALVGKTMDSVTYRNCVGKVRTFSNVLRQDLRPSAESHPSLPSFGALVRLAESAERERTELATTVDGEGEPIGAPVIERGSPFRLLLCLSEFILSLARLEKSLATEIFPRFLGDADIQQYVRRLATAKDHSALTGNYFTKFELRLMMNLLRMASVVPLETEVVDYPRYHRMALSMLPWLPSGSDYLTAELVAVMFRREFLSDVINSLTLPDMTSLSMDDVTHLRSLSGEDVASSRQKLLNDVVRHLDQVRQTYGDALVNVKGRSYKHSRSLHLAQTYSIQSLHVGSVGQLQIPHDWMFLPIVHVYQEHINCPPGRSYDVTPSIVNDVSNCLRYVYLLETCRGDNVAKVSMTTRITRLYCCFLAGSDLFLELPIHCCLAGLLREYSRPINEQQIDWEEKVPGLVSFYDLYVSVLEQFESVSFGDPLFSCYLLLPLQQRYDIKYRKAVWREFPSVLRLLHIPLNELLLPLENFFVPEERDADLVAMYCRALCSSGVRRQWSPLLFLVAVHHVNRFMYSSPRTPLHDQLLMNVMTIRDPDVRHQVLHYKQFAADSDLGFTLFTDLPKHRRTLIDDLASVT